MTPVFKGRGASPLTVTGSLLDQPSRAMSSLLLYIAVQGVLAGGLGVGAGALVGVLASVLYIGRLDSPLVVIGAMSGLIAGLIATVTGREVLPRLSSFSLALRITLGVLTLGGGAFAATGVGFWFYPSYSVHRLNSVLLVGSINGLLALTIGLVVFLYEDVSRRLSAAREELAAERLAQAHARERAARLELQALQARINPHFFFNALNTAAALVHDDPPAAERLLERFSDLFRYTFRRGGEEWAPLEDELGFVADYLAIEKARFGGRLEYSVDTAPELAEAMVPPLILQPLVENAVVHGRDPETGAVAVAVRARRDLSGGMVLEVCDRGPGPSPTDQRPRGHALENIALRLAARGGRVELKPCAEGRGTCARLFLPPPEVRWRS